MNTHFKLFKNKEKVKVPKDPNAYAPKNLTADDLPDQTIYYQAWIKYFSFQKTGDKEHTKPKYFFKNDHFFNQKAEEKEDDQVSFYLLIILFF